jgi:hypothetical protein
VPVLTLPPGAAVTSPSSPPASRGEPTPAPAPTDVVAPALDGPLTCGGEDARFAAAALAGPGGAEGAASPAAAALRQLLSSQAPDGEPLPTAGWHVVIEDAARVVYVARSDGRWWTVELVRAGDGSWQDMDRGECHLAVVLPDGIGFAAWRFDPAGLPAAGDTTLHLLATELACASGRPIGGRLLQPIVLEAGDAVTIALRVRARPGGQDCPGNPEQAVTVKLAAPIGARLVFDGSSVPPVRRN